MYYLRISASSGRISRGEGLGNKALCKYFIYDLLTCIDFKEFYMSDEFKSNSEINTKDQFIEVNNYGGHSIPDHSHTAPGGIGETIANRKIYRANPDYIKEEK